MNAEEIKRIAAVMQEFELTEFKLESEDMRVAIKREKPVVQMAAMPAPAAMAAPLAPAAVPAAAPVAEPSRGETIDAPIVGTFYIAPAPDADAFVKPGDAVNEETVVCIVEAMKVMNEIKAEKKGVIKKILVDNASPVEFGQPLFELA